MRTMRLAGQGSMFRGNELMKLLSMISLLLLVGMLVVRSRDPSLYTWLAPEGEDRPAAEDLPPADAAPVEQTAKPAEEPLLVATGPTDEDEDEADAAKEEFQVVLDGSLEIQPEEMAPYKRILKWVNHQPYPVLRKRARKDLVFTDLYQRPGEHRGKVVALDLNIRRVLPCELDGQKLYEVWGFTTESQAWLYVGIVPELPLGMPVRPSVDEKATLVGYFYKLQGYHEAGSKPNAKPLKSPLVIGRLQGWPLKKPKVEKEEWAWGIGFATLFGVVVLIRIGFLFLGRKRRTKPLPVDDSDPEASPRKVEAWLEQVGSVPIGEPEAGNKPEENHESENGKRSGLSDWRSD